MHRILYIICSHCLDKMEQCKPFDMLVGPILNCSSEVWGIHNAKDVEAIHSKFYCWVPNVKNQGILVACMANLDEFPSLNNANLKW